MRKNRTIRPGSQNPQVFPVVELFQLDGPIPNGVKDAKEIPHAKDRAAQLQPRTSLVVTKSSTKKTSRKSKKPAAGAKSPKSTKSKSSKSPKAERKTAPGKRAVPVDRRQASDRRKDQQPNEETLLEVGYPIERRKKVNRRRQIDPTTCERDYSPDEIEFMAALDEYKRKNGRMFPTCSEILEVIRALGYLKPGSADVAPPVTAPEAPEMAEAAEAADVPSSEADASN
jgi:hypothetical protein